MCVQPRWSAGFVLGEVRGVLLTLHMLMHTHMHMLRVHLQLIPPQQMQPPCSPC